MEEINLKELFDYIKERLYLIAGITAFILVVGCLFSLFIKTPMYQSTTTILVSSASGTNNTNDVQLSRTLVSSFKELIKSKNVANQVIENLDLEYSSETLLNKITVTSAENSEIIDIVVSDKDKGLAADIANEIVAVFESVAKEHYSSRKITVVDVAEEATSPYNTNLLKDLVIYVVIGAVLGLGVVFVIYYFDTTIKNAEEIENKLGLPVIGIVPKVEFKEK